MEIKERNFDLRTGHNTTTHNTELENISFLTAVQWRHLKRFDHFSQNGVEPTEGTFNIFFGQHLKPEAETTWMSRYYRTLLAQSSTPVTTLRQVKVSKYRTFI